VTAQSRQKHEWWIIIREVHLIDNFTLQAIVVSVFDCDSQSMHADIATEEMMLNPCWAALPGLIWQLPQILIHQVPHYEILRGPSHGILDVQHPLSIGPPCEIGPQCALGERSHIPPLDTSWSEFRRTERSITATSYHDSYPIKLTSISESINHEKHLS